MQLKLPPVVVFLVFGGAMWFIDARFSPGVLDFAGHQWVAMIFLAFGGLFGVAPLIQFFRHRTSIDPHKPEKVSRLVTGGIYRISRNPMYLALLLVLIAFGFYFGNLVGLILVPLFVIWMNRYQIIPEEKVLAEKFGEEYRAYSEKVRRWL